MPLLSGQKITPARAGGWIGESSRTAAVGPLTAETVVQSVTFTAAAGVRYRVVAVQSYQSSVAGDLARVRLRWNAGSSLSLGGTEITSQMPNCDVAAKGSPITLQGTFVPGAGQVTVGVTSARESGTGSITMFGDARQANTIIVEGV